MSLYSWKAEFYPIEADQTTTMAQAIHHSLQKWRGLLPNNLKKHDVVLAPKSIYHMVYDEHARDSLDINAQSCALCHLMAVSEPGSCRFCPLAVIRGGAPCDKHSSYRDGANNFSPWSAFQVNKDPRPMIRWLQRLYDLHVAGPMIYHGGGYWDDNKLLMSMQLGTVVRELSNDFADAMRMEAIDSFAEDEYYFDNPDHHTIFLGL